MKFSKNVAKVVLAAAVATAIVAGGCEQKQPEPTKPAPAPTKAPEPKK